MRLPAPLSRQKNNVHKNDFGHVLVVAGSPAMLGAACLTSLSAMRAGAGLVTAAVPRGLNLTLQEKLSCVVMTCPLPQTRQMTFSLPAADILLRKMTRYNVVAIGPGLSLQPATLRFIRQMVAACPLPMVVDADALNALAGHTGLLSKAKGPRVLTPHAGEMARLAGLPASGEARFNRKIVLDLARQWNSVVLLKGPRTLVVSPQGDVYVNTTGNPGMATAGSGDVLTGVIAAFLAQGLSPFQAARWGAYAHGAAGDRAARQKGRCAMIASDIIDRLITGGFCGQ